MTRGINRGRPLRGEGSVAATAPRGLVPTALIVEFGKLWYVFGGPPAEDIMVRFGWSTERYFIELRSILTNTPPPALAPQVIESMLAVCGQRLRAGR